MKNNWPHIHTPQLILDEARVRRNVKRMVKKAAENRKQLRPHFKTHQSQTIGRWCREEGIDKITVSSVGMAEYFAADGWTDITIAFPCNLRQADRINELAEKIDLKLLTDHDEVTRAINKKISHGVGIYIEIDAGSGRSGVAFNNEERLNEIYQLIHSGPHNVAGIYTHSGHTYRCRSAEEVRSTAREAIRCMETAAEAIDGDVPSVCYGDTPSCSILNDFGTTITDISPGNFVFYDMMQVEIGSCNLDDVAVALVCPVVTVGNKDNTFLIHGGAVHFSKETMDDGSYGSLVRLAEKGWLPETQGRLISISQEHGILEASGLEIGEAVGILPVHSCLTAECMTKYLTTTGIYVDHYQKSR